MNFNRMPRCLLLLKLFFIGSIQASSILSANEINIYNGDDYTSHSFVEYPQWVDPTIKDNTEALKVGTLEFKFKTNSRSCILLFANDGITSNGETERNQLQLSLVQAGGLKAEFNMGHMDEKSSKEVTIGNRWNDMEWHHVIVTRNYRQVTVSIDGEEGVMVSFGDEDHLKLTAHVRIGGFETSSGFSGCIKDVKYGSGSGTKVQYPRNTKGKVREGCFTECPRNIRNKCKNGGKCLRYFDPDDECKNCQCDCSLTGFSGETCSVEDPIGYLQDKQYITTITESLRSSRVNHVQFRFRTNQPSGLILYHGKSSEYLLIELVDGNIELEMFLETDKISLRLGSGQFHNGEWHSVLVKRQGDKVMLKVDERTIEKVFKYTPQLTCEGQHSKFLFIGGHQNPNSLPKRLNGRKNFNGCLQQVFFKVDGRYQNEERDILQRSSYSNRFRVEGGAINTNSCPVFEQYIRPVEPTTTVTTTQKTDPAVHTDAKRPTFSKNVDPHVEDGKMKTIPVESHSMGPKNRLSQSTVAWITGGICVGSIALILTLACGFYFLRKRYSGQFSAQYKAAAAARGIYQDMVPVDYHATYQGQQPNGHPKRPKASVIL
ncbi:neurexin-3-like [Clytia hemisphaerica]|uniref:Laminin G domain-containing protein n=1 Tax=Clytia hemisphaerica TaxID=252671 RepID=A0A7M5X731_9CNID